MAVEAHAKSKSKPKTMSEETRRKISISQRKRMKAIRSNGNVERWMGPAPSAGEPVRAKFAALREIDLEVRAGQEVKLALAEYVLRVRAVQ